MEKLKDIISFSNNLVTKLFGYTNAIIIDQGLPKWFRAEYPYRINDNDNIFSITLYAEIHNFCIKNESNVLVGTVGFYFDCKRTLSTVKTPTSQLFNIIQEGNRLDFQYNAKNEYNKANDRNGSIVFNNHEYEIISDCFFSIKENIENGVYLDFFRKLDTNYPMTRVEILGFLADNTNYLQTFNKGFSYSNNGNILYYSSEIYADDIALKGVIRGSNGNIYETNITFNKTVIKHHFCNCMAHQRYPGLCKHIIALVIKYADDLPV